MAKKRAIPEKVLDRVLLDSRRRCCICHESGNDEVRTGAIAPIVAGLLGPEGETEDNLVFLCEQHHAEAELGKITPERLRKAKSELYRSLREGSPLIGGDAAAGSYERHVCTLLTAALERTFNGMVTIHENGDNPGLTGISPVIPFSADVNISGIHIWLVADAKYADRNIGLHDLRTFTEAVRYLKANKGIFVTNTGFSESAVQFANAEGIALAIIKSEDRELKPEVIVDAVAPGPRRS